MREELMDADDIKLRCPTALALVRWAHVVSTVLTGSTEMSLLFFRFTVRNSFFKHNFSIPHGHSGHRYRDNPYHIYGGAYEIAVLAVYDVLHGFWVVHRFVCDIR